MKLSYAAKVWLCITVLLVLFWGGIGAAVAQSQSGATIPITMVDGSGTVTAGGTRQQVFPAITVASLLGLNILSVPTQIATYAHYICIEP